MKKRILLGLILLASSLLALYFIIGIFNNNDKASKGNTDNNIETTYDQDTLTSESPTSDLLQITEESIEDIELVEVEDVDVDITEEVLADVDTIIDPVAYDFPSSTTAPILLDTVAHPMVEGLEVRGSTLIPSYFDGWGAQIIEWTNVESATIAIANYSDETLSVTSKNITYVAYGNDGSNITGSYIVGGDTSIAPHTTKVVTVQKTNMERGQAISITFEGHAGEVFLWYNVENEDIIDTTPYVADLEDYTRIFVTSRGSVLYNVSKPDIITGDGQFKIVAKGVQTVNESEFLGQEIREGQDIAGYLYVELANTTSDLPISIFKISSMGGNLNSDLMTYITYRNEDVSLYVTDLENLTIESNEIVLFRIPFVFTEVQYSDMSYTISLGLWQGDSNSSINFEAVEQYHMY